MKVLKVLLAVLVPLGVIAGVVFGLAKVGIIPLGKFGKKPKAAMAAMKTMRPGTMATSSTAGAEESDPLAAQKRVLAAQHKALDDERAAWQSQVQAANAAKRKELQNPTLDPKAMARMASVYEQMSPDVVTKIFAKLPDTQIIGLLRLMEEKQVGAILANVAPERAARLTLSLSRPVASAPLNGT